MSRTRKRARSSASTSGSEAYLSDSVTEVKMRRFRLIVLLASLVLLPASAIAQGASLHGFGPINSSMGGAGVALPEDSLNALGFNPALLTQAQGNQISFTTEFFEDGIKIHTTYGFLSGDANPSMRVKRGPLLGWSLRQ